MSGLKDAAGSVFHQYSTVSGRIPSDIIVNSNRTGMSKSSFGIGQLILCFFVVVVLNAK